MAGPDDGTLWNEATIDIFDRLIEKTGSMQFIHAHEKPADRSASYYNPRVRIKLKEEKIVRRVRGTVAGDRIDYPGAVSVNAAELTIVKLLLNAVVSKMLISSRPTSPTSTWERLYRAPSTFESASAKSLRPFRPSTRCTTSWRPTSTMSWLLSRKTCMASPSWHSGPREASQSPQQARLSFCAQHSLPTTS
jgi:hypothetical protein